MTKVIENVPEELVQQFEDAFKGHFPLIEAVKKGDCETIARLGGEVLAHSIPSPLRSKQEAALQAFATLYDKVFGS